MGLFLKPKGIPSASGWDTRSLGWTFCSRLCGDYYFDKEFPAVIVQMKTGIFRAKYDLFPKPNLRFSVPTHNQTLRTTLSPHKIKRKSPCFNILGTEWQHLFCWWGYGFLVKCNFILVLPVMLSLFLILLLTLTGRLWLVVKNKTKQKSTRSAYNDSIRLFQITRENKALAKLLHGHCTAHPRINYNVITIADRNTTWVCALSALITDR